MGRGGYVSGLQPSGSIGGRNLGLRPFRSAACVEGWISGLMRRDRIGGLMRGDPMVDAKRLRRTWGTRGFDSVVLLLLQTKCWVVRLLLWRSDGVLRNLRDAELDHGLRFDLDRLAGLGVTAHARRVVVLAICMLDVI